MANNSTIKLSENITYYEIWHSETFGSGISKPEKKYYADFYKLTDSGIETKSHFFGALSSIDEVHKQVKNLMGVQALKEADSDELNEIARIRSAQDKREVEKKREAELSNAVPLGLDESVVYDKLNELKEDYVYGAIDKEEYEHRRKIIGIQAQPIKKSAEEGKMKNEGYKTKSRLGPEFDLSIATLPLDVRAAAEWLIENGFEEKRDVQNAFYDREISCLADDPSEAEKEDNARIVQVAEKYGFQAKIETGNAKPGDIKNNTAGKTAGGIKMQNSVILGRVASDFSVVPAGDKQVGKFSVVYDSGKKDPNGNDIGCFVNVECWSENYQKVLAENIKKGDTVLLNGQISIEDFTQKGHTNKSVKLINPDVKFLGKGNATTAQVFVSGRLTHDVELKKVGDKTVAELSLAENYGNDKTNYYIIECWNKQAEVMGQNLAKGSLISVSGDLSIEPFNRADESKGTKVKILNPNVKFLERSAKANDIDVAFNADKGGK